MYIGQNLFFIFFKLILNCNSDYVTYVVYTMSTAYKAEVIVSLKGNSDEELQLQTRSLQDAIDGPPPEGVLVRVHRGVDNLDGGGGG